MRREGANGDNYFHIASLGLGCQLQSAPYLLTSYVGPSRISFIIIMFTVSTAMSACPSVTKSGDLCLIYSFHMLVTLCLPVPHIPTSVPEIFNPYIVHEIVQSLLLSSGPLILLFSSSNINYYLYLHHLLLLGIHIIILILFYYYLWISLQSEYESLIVLWYFRLIPSYFNNMNLLISALWSYFSLEILIKFILFEWLLRLYCLYIYYSYVSWINHSNKDYVLFIFIIFLSYSILLVHQVLNLTDYFNYLFLLIIYYLLLLLWEPILQELILFTYHCFILLFFYLFTFSINI